MADVRLGPGRLDRINVQNDPVNAIDPWGLKDWNLITSYRYLHNQGAARSQPGYTPPPRRPSEPKPPRPYDPKADLNVDGKVDGWDTMVWFFMRRLWELNTPPFTPYPPGYGNDGPGSNDPLWDHINGTPCDDMS